MRTPGRRRLPGGALRLVLLVTVCVLVTGVAGAAGLWWAGWDRSEPVAVADGGVAAPTAVAPSSSTPRSPVRSSSTVHSSSAVTPAAGSASSPVRRTTTPAPGPSSTQPTSSAGTLEPSATTPVTWTAAVRRLDDARARALVLRDATLLDTVYTRDATARKVDAGTIGTMLAAGLRVSGAAHVTRQVRILSRSPIRVIVEDSLPSYSILDAAGGVVGRTAARDVAPRVLVLVATSAGYRISEVRSA